MQKQRRTINALVLLFGMLAVSAQSVLGKWKTIDDKTGKARSIVSIYEERGKLFGNITELVDPDEPNPVCEECTDERKGQPIIGLQIIRDLVRDGKAYANGKILDPENGKEYKCKIWVDPEDADKLNVRGYIAFLYRTQVWHRTE